MIMFIIGLVIGIIAIALFIFAIFKDKLQLSDGCQKVVKNPSSSKIKPPLGNRYKGLPEPEWNRELPSRADDYVRPRYVYENLAETEEFDSSQGHIIGYRISPTLVIHSMVGTDWRKEEIIKFTKYYKGSLLTWAETKILLSCWDTINHMRQKAGDTPLPGGPIWIMGYEQLIPPQYRGAITLPLAGIVMRR